MIDQSTSAKQWYVNRRREAVCIWFIFAAFYALTNNGFDTSEAKYHYAVATQLLTRGSLSFDHKMEGVFTTAPNGRTYASHEIGNTLLLLPVAAVNLTLGRILATRKPQAFIDRLQQFVLSFVASLLCATALALLYANLRINFFVESRSALLGVTAFAVCTFIWTSSRNLFDGVLCTTLLCASSLFLFFYRRHDRQAYIIGSATLLGFAFITRVSMLLAIIACFLYLASISAWHLRRFSRPAAMFAVTLAPFICWQMFYNHLRTGSIFLSPVQTAQYAENNGMSGDIWQGLTGLLFSPGKSIFIYCPLALLSISCAVPFWRKFRHEAIFAYVLSLSWLLLHAKLRSWFGAWGWGPRHFITISPILALPALVEWDRLWRGLASRTVNTAALSWGFVLSLSAIIGNWLFREELSDEAHRDIVWSLRFSQSVDMLRGVGENLGHIFWGTPFRSVPGISEQNLYASNTVNVWFFAAARAGFPIWTLVLIGVCLVSVIIVGLNSWRKIREREQKAHRGEMALAT